MCYNLNIEYYYIQYKPQYIQRSSMSSIENEHTPSQNSNNIRVVILTLLWVFIPPIYGVVVWLKELHFGQELLRTFSVVFSPMTYVFLSLLVIFIEKTRIDALIILHQKPRRS